jgi:Domain of unknown function (DUF4249)
MKYLKISFLFAALSFFASCSADWFTPIVDIQLPAHVPKLVVYANWQVGNDTLLVFVSKSRSSLDSTPFAVDSQIVRQGGFGRNSFTNFDFDTVGGVKVEVFRNGVSVGVIPQIATGFYAMTGKHRLDSTGTATYKLVVSAPNFKTAEAEQPAYAFPKVTNLTWKLDAAFYTNPNDVLATPRKGDEIAIDFDDKASESNYYDVLSAWFDYKDASGVAQTSRTFVPRSIDPLSEYEVLADKNLSGKNYKWLFWAQNRDYNGGGRGGGPGGGQQGSFTPKKGDKLTMTLRTFNRDWFLFKKSRSLLNQSQDNIFFSEPVLLHTNVKNGYGLFFINAERRYTVTIP